jgi:hypothetical protein
MYVNDVCRPLFQLKYQCRNVGGAITETGANSRNESGGHDRDNIAAWFAGGVAAWCAGAALSGPSHRFRNAMICLG